jgi:GTPase SAR1 family protein
VDRLIVGNKSDQIEKRRVSFEEGYDLAKQHKLEFTEVSALSAENIGQAFEILARKVLKRINTTPQPVNRLPQRLENKKKETGGFCC